MNDNRDQVDELRSQILEVVGNALRKHPNRYTNIDLLAVFSELALTTLCDSIPEREWRSVWNGAFDAMQRMPGRG